MDETANAQEFFLFMKVETTLPLKKGGQNLQFLCQYPLSSEDVN